MLLLTHLKLSCLSHRADRTDLAEVALLKLLSLGDLEDLPLVNVRLICPKRPSHPHEGQGVNYPDARPHNVPLANLLNRCQGD